jgi:NAD(P)H-nitrite reductase large subunit
MKKYCVIGSSAAGIAAVTTLRQLDQHAEIYLFSAQKELPYNKCLLPDYVAGDKQRDEIFIRDASFFDRERIELHLNSRITHINAQEQQLVLENGQIFTYDSLLIATGARALQLSIKYIDALGVFFFYELSDIDSINAYREKNNAKSVIVIGAGLTGIECADAFQLQGLNVTVVDAHEHILAAQIDKEAARVIEQRAQICGINFVLATAVDQIIVKDNKACGVHLLNNQSLYADMVIVAAGEQPNSELAAQAGIKITKNGIVTNEYLQTSAAHVFAAGDVAQVKEIKSGELMRSFKWSDAALQGTIAAHNMVGNKRIYAGIMRISGSHFFGARFFAAGKKDAIGTQVVVNNDKLQTYASITIFDEKIVAVTLYGYEEPVAVVRRAFMQNLSATETGITQWLM